MLKTVSSTNSLIFWDKNQNCSNIELSAIGGDPLFLQHWYKSLFGSMADELKKNPDVFVQLWSAKCDEKIKYIKNAINYALHENGLNAEPEDVSRVADKFRGNAGEILVEGLIANGIINLGVPSTYEPVDPTHERFIDATIERDGMPVGIQIKNYACTSNVGRDVLYKAESMTTHWIQVEKRIPRDQILDFLDSPSQYVIATCKPKNDLILDEVKNAVVYLGPDWLDSLKIQGSKKTGEAPRWRVFKSIADEIEALS